MLVRHDENLWSTEFELPWIGGAIPIPVRMTVIRLADGRLILYSPAPLPPALRAEIDALGPVGFVVAPHMHGAHTDGAVQAYPEAQLLAAPLPPRGRTHLHYHGSLADAPPPAWKGQVDSLLVHGFRLQEVVLLHRPSRTLVITDLCFHVQRSPSRATRTFARANGMWRRFGPSRLIRLLAVSDRAAFERSLEQILAWDFERVIPGHGDVLERGGREAIRAAWLG